MAEYVILAEDINISQTADFVHFRLPALIRRTVLSQTTKIRLNSKHRFL